jgi:Mn-containing catalase
MLLDIGTEEIGHVEMLCSMIGMLLEGAPVQAHEQAAATPVVGSLMASGDPSNLLQAAMNPQHLIVTGGGALPANSMGVPWQVGYIVASGNLLADFRANLNAETQGRLQAVRMYEMTDDPGVRDMLGFMIARDHMHQLQWEAAIEEVMADGLEEEPVPGTFPDPSEHRSAGFSFWNLSEGTESKEGRWASGPTPDGKGSFEYLANPEPLGPEPSVPKAEPRLHGTSGTPPTSASKRPS